MYKVSECVCADVDEPPRSDAGQDVVIQLPTDWAVLDGRDSVDDHAVARYEWTLLRGDTAINMKVRGLGKLPVLLLAGRLELGMLTNRTSVTLVSHFLSVFAESTRLHNASAVATQIRVYYQCSPASAQAAGPVSKCMAVIPLATPKM